MIKIDKGIPIPKQKRKKNYPLREMEITDSFFVSVPPKRKLKSIQSAVRRAIVECRRESPDKRFVTRTIKGGVRCWRVK